MLRGLLLPALAFAIDGRQRVNPLAWGYGGLPFMGEPDGAVPPFGLRALLVDGLVAASALGLVLLLLGRVRAALPLLVLGVAVATAHALVFVPLLPLSLVGALWLVGLLGLAPFVTTRTYLEALSYARGLSTPKPGPPPRWSSPWLGAALGVALVPLVFMLPRTPTPYPAPAAETLAEAELRPEDLEALRRWVATVVGTHGPLEPTSAPEGSRDLWREARVWPHAEYVEWQWSGRPGFRGWFSLLVLPPGVDLPPNEGAYYRCVEVAPGAWSRYVRTTPPRDAAVFVRLPASGR